MALEAIERLYRLTVDGNQAVRQLDDIARSVAGVEKQLSHFGELAKGVFEGLAAGLSVGAIGAAFKRTIDNFDELGKAAQKFGLSSVEELSKLKYAADLSNVSLESLGKGIKTLAVNMQDIAD